MTLAVCCIHVCVAFVARSTHAQKYFQKLSKAQASGTSHLDPATLMSTMDAGKPRPASVSR
ncbi:unnamed protein product [Ectocarpus sp. 12 AP-2014]